MKTILLFLTLILIPMLGIADSNIIVYGGGETIIEPGNYGVIEVRTNGHASFKNGHYTVHNLTTNQRNITVQIYADADVRFVSSWNMPGDSHFINQSPKTKVNAIELQNGGNVLSIYADLECNDFQINDNTSVCFVYYCETTLKVNNSTNLNNTAKGKFHFIGGGELVTNGLSVGVAEIFTGKGFVRVNGNFNVNQKFTDSDEITLCYNGRPLNPNELQNLEGVKMDCKWKCESMPVTLVAFSASKTEVNTLLEWSTTEEVNSDRFEIERSLNGRDWTMLGTVASNGDSKVRNVYRYEDLNPVAGNNLYRLKMVDRDNTYAYSKIEAVHWKGTVANVYPNPASDSVTISSDIKSYTIVNSMGVVVSYGSASRIDVSKLPAGLYVVNALTMGGNVDSYKVYVKR